MCTYIYIYIERERGRYWHAHEILRDPWSWSGLSLPIGHSGCSARRKLDSTSWLVALLVFALSSTWGLAATAVAVISGPETGKLKWVTKRVSFSCQDPLICFYQKRRLSVSFGHPCECKCVRCAAPCCVGWSCAEPSARHFALCPLLGTYPLPTTHWPLPTGLLHRPLFNFTDYTYIRYHHPLH